MVRRTGLTLETFSAVKSINEVQEFPPVFVRFWEKLDAPRRLALHRQILQQDRRRSRIPRLLNRIRVRRSKESFEFHKSKRRNRNLGQSGCGLICGRPSFCTLRATETRYQRKSLPDCCSGLSRRSLLFQYPCSP